jgi:uncharacterized damage-inducible protein DinB
MSNRPTEHEYAPYYAQYIHLVPEENILAALEASTHYTTDVLNTFSDEQAARLHGTTQWTLKQTLGHLCDAERVFAYRAMRIARGDQTPMASFEQDDYVAAANANQRPWDDIISEYRAVRAATIALAKSCGPEEMKRTGTASGKTVSTRALFYIAVGHERRHMELVRQHAK